MRDLTEVASGVFVVQGTHVNGVLVVDGKDVTLVDSGYYGDAGRVAASLDRSALGESGSAPSS